MKTQIAQLMEKNEALQASMETIQQQQQVNEELHHGEMDDPDPQPLSVEIWDAPIPENFKLPSLSFFNAKSDPVEYVTTFKNTNMQKGSEDWSNKYSEELEGFWCLSLEKGQCRTNNTIVPPLPQLLQHFQRIVQATSLSRLDWNG